MKKVIGTYDVKELVEIISRLEEMAEAEATKLYRLAWRAKAHGCSDETVEEIRNEARELHMIGRPERLLDAFKTWKYAFR
ncbi:MAG: hypothetical protein IKW37_01190 [Bacteroidaceae bacterium]|nr:hypothetical protein [Bacteroidaceae bacterium]